MVKRKQRDFQELLDFLGIEYRLASNDTEIELSFCPFHGGGWTHVYLNKDSHTWTCHRCGEAGLQTKLEQAILRYVVEESVARYTRLADGYWESRSIPETMREERKLGYWPSMNRYTIPFFSGDQVSNIRFRARTETQKPKYLGLPGSDTTPYVIGDDSDTVILAEGEIDALSVYLANGDVMAVGLLGAGNLPDSFLSQIPSRAVVIAIVDNDAAGKKSAKKLQSKIPGLRIVSPEDAKDVNALFCQEGPEAVNELIQLALEGTPSDSEEVMQEAVTTPVGVPSTIYLSMPDESGDWLIEDLWMEKALGFVAGIPKAMKSLLALHLGYHIAEGIPFASKRITRPGPVLFVQEEDHDHIIRRRLRAINGGRGSTNLWVCTPGVTGSHVQLDDDRSIEMLDGAIVEVGPVLVILDPLANMHSLEDENAAGPMNRLLERLRRLRDLRGCSFMIVHHMGKEGEHTSKHLGQRMRGSSVLHAKSECSLYVERIGKLLHITVENKMAPTRYLDLTFDEKPARFELQDEWGAGVEEPQAAQ